MHFEGTNNTNISERGARIIENKCIFLALLWLKTRKTQEPDPNPMIFHKAIKPEPKKISKVENPLNPNPKSKVKIKPEPEEF